MKNLMDIDFYNDNWDKTSFTLSDYTNISISIYTNHDEQEHLDTDFYLNYVILTFKKPVYLKIQHYILTNQLQNSLCILYHTVFIFILHISLLTAYKPFVVSINLVIYFFLLRNLNS